MHLLLRIRQADKEIYEDLRSGAKSIETRAATAKYQKLAKGDTVTFLCGKDRFSKRVGKVYRWKSITAMAKAVPFKKVMPRAASLAEVRKIYASYPGYAEKIREHGLIGFTLV